MVGGGAGEPKKDYGARVPMGELRNHREGTRRNPKNGADAALLRLFAPRLDALDDDTRPARRDEDERETAEHEERQRERRGAPRVQLVGELGEPLALPAGLGLPATALGDGRRGRDERVRPDPVACTPPFGDRALQRAQDVVVGARVRLDVGREVIQCVVITSQFKQNDSNIILHAREITTMICSFKVYAGRGVIH